MVSLCAIVAIIPDFDLIVSIKKFWNCPTPIRREMERFLLAMRRSEVVGCIAHRAAPTPLNPRTCEIKRLFVLPQQRGHGIGSDLVSTCVDRARARGYQLACLDTEPKTMAAAHHTYLRLGFVEYERHYSATEGPVAFLKKPLCELAESAFHRIDDEQLSSL
jgi:GNAT superfamily N-acetyltransferase